MFKNLKGTMSKERKESMRTMCYQITVLIVLDIIKKNQIGILDLKSTITEMKNLLEELTGRFQLAEEKN